MSELQPRFLHYKELYSSEILDARSPTGPDRTVSYDLSPTRDDYGNRRFTSPQLLYLDRQDTAVKASLLISQEGERFIKEHRGILHSIEDGIQELYLTPIPTKKQIDMGEERSLQPLVDEHGMSLRGGQSEPFLLEVQGKKYIIKLKVRNPFETVSDVSQPYIHEMLQSQQVAHDLADILSTYQIAMPTFLFASGHMSCTEFVEGTEPERESFPEKAGPVIREMRAYIAQQQDRNNALWHNIAVDYKLVNFIKQDTGTLVFIDPFYYLPLD